MREDRPEFLAQTPPSTPSIFTLSNSPGSRTNMHWFSDSAPTSPRPVQNVVVIGSGFCGGVLVKALDHSPLVKITVIEPRDYLLSKFSTLRSAAQAAQWSSWSVLPLNQLLQHTKRTNHVCARVSRISHEEKTVTCDNGAIVPYDILVICSGTRNFSPGEPPTADSMTEIKDYWKRTSEILTTGQRFAVVGAGPVAVETAGEIRVANPTAKVSLLVGKHSLLSSTGFAPKHVAYVEEQLAALNIDVVKHDNLVSPSVPSKDAQRMSEAVLTDVECVFESGKRETFDALVFAVGGFFNASAFCPPDWLDAVTGEVLIDDFFRVKGISNVFCCGDAAQVKNRAKVALWAVKDGSLVAANVLSVVEGREPANRVKVPHGSVTLIPIGDKHGILVGANGWIFFGNFLVSSIKGKDLFTNRVWRGAGLMMPPLSVDVQSDACKPASLLLS